MGIGNDVMIGFALELEMYIPLYKPLTSRVFSNEFYLIFRVPKIKAGYFTFVAIASVATYNY